MVSGFRLDAEAHARLVAISQATGQPIADLIRQAIDRFLDR